MLATYIVAPNSHTVYLDMHVHQNQSQQQRREDTEFLRICKNLKPVPLLSCSTGMQYSTGLAAHHWPQQGAKGGSLLKALVYDSTLRRDTRNSLV